VARLMSFCGPRDHQNFYDERYFDKNVSIFLIIQ
jgi:hypothetical protein